MFRVTSLGSMPDQRLDRLTRRIAFLVVLGTVAFGAFYVLDRHPIAGPSLVDRQISRAEETVRSAPDNIPARMALAGLYLSAKRYPDATDQFGQILTIQPDHKLALLGRGTAYFLAGDLTAAEPMYQRIVDSTKDLEFSIVDPSIEEAHYYLGLIASQTGRLDRALAEYQAALAIEPTDADATYGLGMTYLALGRPGEAVEPLRASTLFVPLEWTEPYVALEDAYTRLGETSHATWANAMADLTRGDHATGLAKLQPLAHDGGSLDVLLGIAFATEALGDAPGALEWYRQALTVDPESFSAQQGVGRLAQPGDPALPVAPTEDPQLGPPVPAAVPPLTAPHALPAAEPTDAPAPDRDAGTAVRPGAIR